MLPELSPRYIAGRLRSVQHSETIRLVADARTFAPRTASSCKQAMAMALTHGAFDDDFFSGFPLSALMHGNPRGHDGTPGNRGIPLDVKETKNTFEVKADLPGVEKKDIKVNVDGDVLTISHEHTGKKEDKKEENGVKYHRVERSSAFVQRRVRLPESADMSKIKAAYNNGTLTLDIHKAEEKTRTRQINVE